MILIENLYSLTSKNPKGFTYFFPGHASSKSSRQPLTSLHPEGNGGFEVQQQQPPQPLLMQPQSLSYRSSLYGINYN